MVAAALSAEGLWKRETGDRRLWLARAGSEGKKQLKAAAIMNQNNLGVGKRGNTLLFRLVVVDGGLLVDRMLPFPFPGSSLRFLPPKQRLADSAPASWPPLSTSYHHS